MDKFTKAELSIILQNSQDSLRILNTADQSDLKVLCTPCTEIDYTDEYLKLLISRMYQTVQDEKHKGVGIAAPQIGINRRVFLVQRVDKIDKPFEFYINPEITWYSKIKRVGEEGCLSISNLYAEVVRSLAIQITYYDLTGKHYQEVVEGYAAVIMQHEFDHLNGVLFPDRIEEQKGNEYFDAVPPVINLKYKK